MTQSLEREIQGLRSLLGSERDPDGRAFVALADAYRRGGQLERALHVVSEGLDRHPSLASGHVVAAWIHRDLGDRGAAQAEWGQVLELDEENVEALRGLGTLLLESGRMDEARPYLERVRALDPEEAAHAPAARLPGEAMTSAASPEEAHSPMHEAPAFAEASVEVGPAAEAEGASPTPAEQHLEVEAAVQAEVAPETPGAPEVELAAEAEVIAEVLAMAESETGLEIEPAFASEFAAGGEPAFEIEPAAQAGADAPASQATVTEEEPEEPAPAEIEVAEVGGESHEVATEAAEATPSEEEPPVVAAGAAALPASSEITEVWSDAGEVEGEVAGEVEDEQEVEPPQIPPTRTLAELFARQGLHARAAEIYERLLHERPEDSALRDRLEELRAGDRSPRPAVHAADTETIARELSEVSAAPEAVSPFGWATEEASHVRPDEGGEPVSSYFQRLLAWEPGATRAEEPAAAIAEPLVAIEEPLATLEVPSIDVPLTIEESVAIEAPAAAEEAVAIDESVTIEAPAATEELPVVAESAPTPEPSAAADAEAPAAVGFDEPTLERPELAPAPALEEPAAEAAVAEPASVVEEELAPPEPAAEAPAAVQAPDIAADARVVPIESLAPQVVVPIESLAPGPVVPISDLAPDSVPIESLAPDGWSARGAPTPL